MNDHEYFNTYLIPIFVISIAIFCTSNIPNNIAILFKNFFFRILLVVYIVYKSEKYIHLTISVALGFLLIMHSINKSEIKKLYNNNV
jgi:hypothetical protein